MADELSDFQWDVAACGHKWINTKTALPPVEDGLFLSDENPIGSPRPVQRYVPLRLFPGLFKIFSELEPITDSIVRFADKYGMLGGRASVGIVLPLPNSPKPGKGVMGHGELLSFWTSEITQMKEMVSIWEAARDLNEAELRKYIQWDNDLKGVRYQTKYSVGTIANQNIRPELLSKFLHPIIDPALYWIQREVNKKLSEHSVVARLLWSHRHALELHIVPSSLIGCLWLQFANAVAGEKQFRQCPECHKWFDISRHEARVDKKFCTPSCKAAAHRRKDGVKTGKLSSRTSKKPKK